MDWVNIGLFFGLQLVNVVLSTMRSILTVKASKHVAAIMNAISYTFYSAVVKLITSQDMYVVCAVTFVTNIIGVYIANWVLEKAKRDKLWRISATVKGQKKVGAMGKSLEEYNIGYNVTPCEDCEDKFIFDIFSYSQGESVLIKEVLTNYNVKYCVMEISKKL